METLCRQHWRIDLFDSSFVSRDTFFKVTIAPFYIDLLRKSGCEKMSSENLTVEASTTRREEFQKYLVRTGVTELLSDLLASLYKKEERPDDVFEYVRKYLSDYRKGRINSSDIEILKKDLMDAKTKVKDLKKRINRLENKMTDQPDNINVPK